MKSERGSITLFVLMAMIFFLAIAMTAFVSASNKLQGQNDELERIQASYSQDLNKEALSGLYDRLKTPTLDTNTLVGMYNKAIADGCDNSDGNCTNPEHLHIGDYVNYINPSSGEYEVTSNTLGVAESQKYYVTQNQVNWRVLGIEGTGLNAKIKLVAGSPLKKSNTLGTQTDETFPYLTVHGPKAYTSSINELNSICSLYKNNYAAEARSITMDDINEITGVNTEEKIRQYNMTIVDYNGNKNYGDTFGPFENHYTPESWVNGQTQTTVSGTVTAYYYSINSHNTPTVTMSNTRQYNMLFENVQLGTGKAYWVSSLGILSGDYNFAGYGLFRVINGYPEALSLFDSHQGNESTDACAVRPVVILKPEVTKDQIPRIADRIETNWNY